MATPDQKILRTFKCPISRPHFPAGLTCPSGLLDGLNADYSVRGNKVFYRDQELGDLTQLPLQKIICGDHCADRFFELCDENAGKAQEVNRHKLRVVTRHKRPAENRFNINQFKGGDF